jgi:glycopeptide antibiotics resistance protein
MRVQRTAARLVLTALTAGYLWAVGWMTLRAQPYGADIATGLDRLLSWFAEHASTAWITFDRVEFAANVAMFLPLGILAVLWFGVRGWWSAIVIGALVSGAIESAQAVFLETRVPDLRDILANTLGAALGMLLMLLLAFLLTPRRSAPAAAGPSA